MDEIRVRGIYGKGYGQVAKAVMMDPHISIEAKGIYGYFCSYTGSGVNTAFPSVRKIINDLDVTDTTYYRHFKILTELGLITVEQANGGDGKGFKRNIYTIEDYPAAYIQFLKSSGDRREITELIIREKSISAAGYGNVPKSVMTNSGISLSDKGLYAYLCAYAGASHSAIPSKDITLPCEYCTDPDKLETAVKAMTGGDYRMQAGAAVEDRQLYCTFVDALCDMLRADTPPLRVKGSRQS